MQLAVLCTAAGMNVAITRTTIATTLILAFLPGEPAAIPAILMASLCSLFATSYMVCPKLPSAKCGRSDCRLIEPSLIRFHAFLSSLSSRVRSHEVILTTACSMKNTASGSTASSKKKTITNTAKARKGGFWCFCILVSEKVVVSLAFVERSLFSAFEEPLA